MAECGRKAVLLITRKVLDTSTNVARLRVELRCALAAGHTGPHADPLQPERWEGDGSRIVTLLRQDDQDD